MEKFLKNIIIFFVPLIFVSYVIEIFLSRNLSQSNESPGNYNTWNDIYNNQVNSDVVIYGSSRASMQIDPQILEDSLELKVYNFGMLGHNFLTQYLRHLEFLKYNKPPKEIILSVDYFSFEKRIDLYEADQFLPYMLWNYNIWKYTNSYNGFSLLDHSLPLLRYYGKATVKKKALLMAINKSQSKPLKYKGFRSTNKEWNKNMEESRKKRGLYTIKNDAYSVQLFYKFLQECKEKEIRVSLVYTPEYYKENELVSNRGETFDIFNNAIAKYNILFFNYSNDSICFDKDYFYNAIHLNKTGVELFSRKLAHDLKSEYSR